MPQPKGVVRQWIDTVWNRGDLSAIDTFHPPKFLNEGAASSPGEARRWHEQLRTVFPDADYTIEDLFDAGQKVVVRWKAQGTHRGTLWGLLPPTGKEAEWHGIHIVQVEDEKIVDVRAVANQTNMLQQLGARIVPQIGTTAGAQTETTSTLIDDYAQMVSTMIRISENYFYAGRLNDAVRLPAQGKQFISANEAENADVHQADQARLLIQQGKMLKWSSLMGDNHFAQVESTLNQANSIAESLDDKRLQAYAQMHLGNMIDLRKVLTDQGDWHEAMALLQQAQSLFLAMDDKPGLGSATFFIGLIHQRLRDKDAAGAYFAQALELARQNQDAFEESQAVRHLGYLAFLEGDWDETYQSALESLRLIEQINCWVALSSAHHAVGTIQEARDESAEALASYHKAVELAEALTLNVPLIQALLALSALYQKQEQREKSAEYAQQAHRIAQTVQYPTFIKAAASRLEEIAQ